MIYQFLCWLGAATFLYFFGICLKCSLFPDEEPEHYGVYFAIGVFFAALCLLISIGFAWLGDLP